MVFLLIHLDSQPSQAAASPWAPTPAAHGRRRPRLLTACAGRGVGWHAGTGRTGREDVPRHRGGAVESGRERLSAISD